MRIYYELFLFTYTTVKGIGTKITKKWYENLVSMIALILTFVLLAIGFLLLFPWFIYHFMVKTYLEFHHRQKFGGLLSSNAAMEHSKMTITTVYILEHHGSYEQLLANLKKSCENLMRSHHRFTSTTRKCCGYYYFLKEQVSIDDVISIAEEKCSTKKDLLDYLRNNSFHDLDGAVMLWSVKVFRNPITWNADNKLCCYPVVITYNHCLADAICLAIFQQKYLLEDVGQKKFENALRTTKRTKKIFMNSNVLQLGLGVLKTNLPLLNSANPQQNLALFIEEEPKYFGLIRELSKRLKCTFTDVFLIASVIVLVDYLEEKNIFPPEIRVGNSCRVSIEDLGALLNGKIFDNEMSMDLYALPNVKCESILEKFLKLREVLNAQRNSTAQVLYATIRVMSYLPVEVLVRCGQPVSQSCLLGITNIPGVDFARFGGAVVKDSFNYVNHALGAKFGVGIHSYSGRLQMSLISEKYVTKSNEDLQEVLEKVFKVIDDLHEQCKSLPA